MNKESLRKKSVIGFICLGLILAVVDANKPEPLAVSGVGKSYNGDLKVEIKVKPKGDSFKILGVDVAHKDTPPIADPALETLKSQTMIKQHHELDVVAGATYTSNGYMDALEDAMSNVKF